MLERELDQDKLITNLDDSNIDLFFSVCGGVSYNSGLYRTHTSDSSLKWSSIISSYFEKYLNKIVPFGFDWMGRQYCIDKNRSEYLLMFDPATSEDFELKQNFIFFHNYEIVAERKRMFSEDDFKTALTYFNLRKLEYSDCIIHKIPLFLGGEDVLDNYEISDIIVSWEFLCQAYQQIKNLPPGTKINSIKFE